MWAGALVANAAHADITTTTITGNSNYSNVYNGPFTLTYVSNDSAAGAITAIEDPFHIGITSELSSDPSAADVVTATLKLGSTTLHFSGPAGYVLTLGNDQFDLYAGPVVNNSPNVLFGFNPGSAAYGGAVPDYHHQFSASIPSGYGNFSYFSADPSHTEEYGSLFGTNVINTSSPAVVPEPAAWTMMLAGFGVLGARLRSRRRPDFAAAWSRPA
jgi:hypothetical protein